MCFFFVILGLKTVEKPIKDGFRIRKTCERCRLLSDLVEHRIRQYFTMFFLPVFPVSRGERTLVCTRCRTSFPLQSQAYGGASSDGVGIGDDEGPGEKTVVTCSYCNGHLRIPVRPGHKLMVTCPHCREQFDVQLDPGR
jgi:uncharacterized protein YbaR (Trm112 family)